jgi:hypothetical protein
MAVAEASVNQPRGLSLPPGFAVEPREDFNHVKWSDDVDVITLAWHRTIEQPFSRKAVEWER